MYRKTITIGVILLLVLASGCVEKTCTRVSTEYSEVHDCDFWVGNTCIDVESDAYGCDVVEETCYWPVLEVGCISLEEKKL